MTPSNRRDKAAAELVAPAQDHYMKRVRRRQIRAEHRARHEH